MKSMWLRRSPPNMEDVLMRPSNLHLPEFQEVEDLALLLLKFIEGVQHIIPAPLGRSLPKLHGICKTMTRAPATLSKGMNLSGATLCLGDAWAVTPRRVAHQLNIQSSGGCASPRQHPSQMSRGSYTSSSRC